MQNVEVFGCAWLEVVWCVVGGLNTLGRSSLDFLFAASELVLEACKRWIKFYEACNGYISAKSLA